MKKLVKGKMARLWFERVPHKRRLTANPIANKTLGTNKPLF
ncbi:MAG: hypothetical protein QMD88_06280 [Coprothermobacterota bacterium]|nr:hypothetical protein [Coprothermobacterota bacterium]